MAVVSDYTSLLSGDYWYVGGPAAKPTVLTYSFLSASPAYGTGSGVSPSTFTPLTASEQAAVRTALAAWSSVAGLTFLETSLTGDLTFGNYALPAGQTGLGAHPSVGATLTASQTLTVYSGDPLSLAGDVYFDPKVASYTPAQALRVALHEIGHALGLKHPFEGTTTLEPALENGAHTIMSYNGAESALGDLDIAAIQAIYGRPGATNPALTWSWDAASNTLTQRDVTAGDYVHGSQTNNIIYAGVNSAVATGPGNDVVFGSGPTFSANLGLGTDILVLSSNAPSAVTFNGTSFSVYTGKDSAGNDGFQRFLNTEYIEFSDAVYGTAQQRFLDRAGFAQLKMAYSAILRTSGAPSSHLSLAALAESVETGSLTQSGAIAAIINQARATSTIATLSYQLFTGSAPTAAGMDYLVAPDGPNPNNLNSSYYALFNLENRFINFAVNLGKNGPSAASFAAVHGSESLLEAAKSLYSTIFGVSASDEKAHALVDPRADYFQAYGLDGPNGLGTKAALAGWLLAEAVKADVGDYAKSNDAYLAALANGASFGVDIIGKYDSPGFHLLG